MYRDSLAIRGRLAKSDPGNVGWQRNLSASHGNLAIALRQAGQEHEARDHLTAGRAIIAQLVQQYPAWGEWNRDLAWFDKQIAALPTRLPHPVTGSFRDLARLRSDAKAREVAPPRVLGPAFGPGGKIGSQRTRRWREMDSNFQFRAR